jgi:hypothetical protein
MQSPPLRDRHLEREDIPLVPRSAAEGVWPGGSARDLDPMFDRRGGKPPMDSPIRSGRSPRVRNNRIASDRPSIGRRVFGPLARIAVAILIGVVATTIWQSNGDKAKEVVKILAPSLGWLLPDSTTTATGEAKSRELGQQLVTIARDLAAVRRSVEQVAAKQEQMDQNIVTMQAIEQEIRQKVMSSPPPSRAAPAQAKSPPPSAQSFSATPPPPAGPLR